MLFTSVSKLHQTAIIQTARWDPASESRSNNRARAGTQTNLLIKAANLIDARRDIKGFSLDRGTNQFRRSQKCHPSHGFFAVLSRNFTGSGRFGFGDSCELHRTASILLNPKYCSCKEFRQTHGRGSLTGFRRPLPTLFQRMGLYRIFRRCTQHARRPIANRINLYY